MNTLDEALREKMNSAGCYSLCFGIDPCGSTAIRPRCSWATPGRWHWAGPGNYRRTDTPAAGAGDSGRGFRDGSGFGDIANELFQYTRRRYGTGRRIFLMSPIHHHFEKQSWQDNSGGDPVLYPVRAVRGGGIEQFED